MSKNPHTLCVGFPSTSQREQGTRAGGLDDDIDRTAVDSVETAERHLSSSVTFDAVVVDDRVLDGEPATVIDRLQSARPTVPVVVTAPAESVATRSRSLAAIDQCHVVSRDHDLSAELRTLEAGADGGEPPAYQPTEGSQTAVDSTGGASITEATGRREKLERYETIMQTVDDGVYVLDDDRQFIAVNDAYVELTGYSREELLGRPAATVVGTERTEQADVIQADLEDGDSVASLRTTMPRADGETIPVEARISLFPLADGATGRVGVVRDISDRLQLEQELGEVLERISDAFFALDSDWQFTYVNEQAKQFLERDAEDLRGKTVWEAFPGAVGSTFEAEYREAMRTGESTTFVEYFPPLDAWFRVHAYPSETGLSVYFADISEERRQSRKLDALTEAVQSFPDARTATAVAERTVDCATDALEVQQAVVALYDGERGRLEQTARNGPQAGQLFEAIREAVAWEAYVEGEWRSVALDADAEANHAVVVPLDSHGVLTAATSVPDGYSDADINHLSILGTHATSALDRADRESRLRKRKNALEAKNDSLKRLNRLNSIIRQITKVLTQAGTREEIETAVCENLAETEPYRLAWFSRYESRDETLVPTASVGIDREELEVTDIGADGQAPARAAESESVTVRDDIQDRDPPYEPWERTALKSGCQSCLAVPVRYRGVLYGVLTLCASDDGTIDEKEQTVLSELGRTIGYAMNALDRKRALASEQTVDLEFRTGAFEDPLFDLLHAEATDFELETLVQRQDGYVHGFFEVSGVATDALTHAGEQSLATESLSIVAEREAGLLIECSFRSDSLFSTLLDSGAMVRSIDLDGEAVGLVVRAPQSTDVRRVIERLEAQFGEVELVSRRERDEPIRSVREFQSEFEKRLTDRQRQVIETAYYSGFFDWPRESTGVEVAEMLDVSQPTINRHIRRGERELFGILFDEE